MTTQRVIGSRFFRAALLLLIPLGCGTPSSADSSAPQPTAPRPQISKDREVAGESCLGVADKGLWSDLDDRVQITLPKVTKDRVTAKVDAGRGNRCHS